MPANNKPGVDWQAIRRRYEAGETPYAIAKLYDVTQQGIRKRIQKEGWEKGIAPDPELLNTVPEYTEPEVNWLTVVERNFKTPVGSKDNPRRRASILRDLANGLPKKAAAAGAGITDDTLTAWCKADTDFSAQCDEAQAQYIRRRFGDINKASERGDVKAATWTMERHPMTREDYGNANRGAQGGGITVVLNVPAPSRDEPLDVVSGDLIEGDFTRDDS